MTIKNNQILTSSESSRDFSEAAELVEENYPKYAHIDLSHNPVMDLTDDEKINVAAKRVLEKYRSAFEALAK